MKHDMRNHLICILQYIEQGNVVYAKQYMEEILEQKIAGQKDCFIESGNKVIDVLFNYKYSIMSQLGIDFITHIEIPTDMKIADADLCIILGNCIDNAIEAVRKIEDGRQKKIYANIVFRKESLLIKITNPYTGLVKYDRKGTIITTKADAIHHGLGLGSITNVSKKYDGLINIDSSDNMFSIQILLYTKDDAYFYVA